MTGEPLFCLGQLTITPPALQALCRLNISWLTLIARHVVGDWGDLDPDDIAANDHAVRHDGRILSSYGESPDTIWVITEADRSTTTILLPEDY